jgi:nitrogen-specific signal transduction histidine kinase
LSITERKQLEEQLRQSQKMDAIGQLSGGVAHDFNNILTAILGNATLLSDPQLERGEAQECLEEIIRAARRAADLTRQLLLFSRKQAMQPAAVDLNQVVSRSIKMLQRILGEDITLHSEHAPGLRPILADTAMIEQAILNLAVNARDAMPHGGRLTICTSSQTVKNPEAPDGEAARPHVCLAVTDTGLGIAREILPHIFEPFFTTKEVGKGTGLGLSLCYGMIREHGGNILVASPPGAGASFTIELPVADEAAWFETAFLAKTTATATSQPDVREGSGKKILVVDDEESLLQMIQEELVRHSYDVVTVLNGEAALRELRAQKFDAVVCDLKMPGLNGRQVYERLREENPEASRRIVFVTGDIIGDQLQSFLDAEKRPCLTKPFSLGELREAVKTMIAGQ